MQKQTKGSIFLLLCAMIWGSAFVAQSEGMQSGGFSCEYTQPAGKVRASVERQNGRVIAAAIGGPVTLGEVMCIDLPEA